MIQYNTLMSKSNKTNTCPYYKLLWGRWLGAATPSLTLSLYIGAPIHTPILKYEAGNVLFYLYITFILFFSSHFHFLPSGQAVVSGVVPPPRYPPSVCIAHRVQHSHCSSTFIECIELTLSRFPRVNLCTRKRPNDFIPICIRRGSNSRN